MDPFPHACVDCHIDYPEMKLDARFGTMMAQWNEQVPPELLAKAGIALPKGGAAAKGAVAPKGGVAAKRAGKPALEVVRQAGGLGGIALAAGAHGDFGVEARHASLQGVGDADGGAGLQRREAQAAGADRSARLREQAERAAAFAERSRLARELHDSVTQSLYSVTLYAQAIADLLSDGQASSARQTLRELQDTAQEALREMREAGWSVVICTAPPAKEVLAGEKYLWVERRLGTAEL